MNQKELKLKMFKPLTNFDIEKYGITQDRIIKYSELNDFEDLSDEILTQNKSYKILLFEYEKNKGHWVLILRYNNIIEFFNSYGVKHTEDDFIDDDELNEYLGQYRLWLNDLLNREIIQNEFKIIYNKIKFQKKSKKINTCGRHVVLRILCLLYYDMTLDDYIKFMNKALKTTNLNDFDELVTLIIS